MRPVFITGTGTDIGKTVAAAILVNALKADYWKPVQAGFDNGTDSAFVELMRQSETSIVYPELYKLKLAASPHLAARKEGIQIDLQKIKSSLPPSDRLLVIEGPGGIMVPLNDKEMVIDLIIMLKASVILVSRNYLGSINHSLLTAAICREKNIDVIGWIFNDDYGNYEAEIAAWSGYPVIAKIPRLQQLTAGTLSLQVDRLKEQIETAVLKKNA